MTLPNPFETISNEPEPRPELDAILEEAVARAVAVEILVQEDIQNLREILQRLEAA